MALLAEYAITPDVFDVASYGSGDLCGVYLQSLKDVMLSEGLVRDLRDGEWAKIFAAPSRTWHTRGRELLKKLASQKRLVASRPALVTVPGDDHEWCSEALASHGARPLRGIIAADAVAAAHGGKAIVESVSRLHTVPWWSGRSPSLRLRRSLDAYRGALELVLRHANSIMMIDPHFDPSKPQYRDAVTLIAAAGGRAPRPLIEIHRVAWMGDGRDKRALVHEVEGLLRGPLQPAATASGLSFEVFLWNDFHDRFVISDLIGISMQNGFDTTTADVTTTWNRLSRIHRDDVQRAFYPAAGKGFRHRFVIEP